MEAESENGPDVGFGNLTAHLQGNTSSNSATPTKPSQKVPPNWGPGIQIDEPMRGLILNQTTKLWIALGLLVF